MQVVYYGPLLYTVRLISSTHLHGVNTNFLFLSFSVSPSSMGSHFLRKRKHPASMSSTGCSLAVHHCRTRTPWLLYHHSSSCTKVHPFAMTFPRLMFEFGATASHFSIPIRMTLIVSNHNMEVWISVTIQCIHGLAASATIALTTILRYLIACLIE